MCGSMREIDFSAATICVHNGEKDHMSIQGCENDLNEVAFVLDKYK